MNLLLAADVAVEYLRTEGWRRLSSAPELLADIERYLSSKGLSGTRIDRYDIAEHVLRLQAAKVPSPEQEAFESDVREGTTATDQQRVNELAMRRADELALAARVRQMPMNQFGAERERLGVTQSLASFLAGE